MNLIKKLISFIIAATLFITCLPTAFAENSDEFDEYSANSNDLDNSDNYEPIFYLPGNLRATVIIPNQEITEEIFDDIARMGMNTVIIATSDGENVFYNTDMNKSDKPDYVLSAVEIAQNRMMNVFLTFDINTVSADYNPANSLNSLITEVHKFTLKYYCDGIIFDNYYGTRSGESFKKYMSFGAGIGYENWLFDNTANYFKTAADTVRLTNNSIAAGIILRDYSGTLHPPSGGRIPAQSDFDGFADTLDFIQNGYADFALVDAPDALTDSHVNLPFAEITEYWGKACDRAEIPMYIVHHNEFLGESKTGWGGDDQLLRQLSVAKSTPAYNGSVFNSYAALVENRLNSTDTLRNFFNDQINEETLFEDMIINSPLQQNFSTNDSVAVFQGTYDDNFEVELNGEPISLNQAGNFYIEEPLEVGTNYFTLKHKGKEVKYSIERKVVALHSIDASIASGKTLEVEGGTVVTISAIAYRDATVTATINGRTVYLAQQSASLDNPALNAAYAQFTGKYNAPAGIIGQTQNLGNITVTAKINGYSMNAIGANLRVIALPEPPPPPPPVKVELLDQNSAGTGEIVGRIDPIHSENERLKYVKVLNNNTEVYAANTTGLESNPDISRVPAGTIDYLRSSAGGWNITENGKRVSSDFSIIEEGQGMGDNPLTVIEGGTANRKGYLQISLKQRSSFNVKAAGVNYSVGVDGDFEVGGFDSSYIYVDFDNVTSVTKLPSFETNQVFSAGRWETLPSSANSPPKFRLVLTLRRKGVYGGDYSYYDSNGDLMLTFNAAMNSNSLSGMNIVIDPGHGITADGGLDPGAIGEVREHDVNVAVAQKLRDRLRALGANATILPTNESYYATKQRPDYARGLDCDLFISLHCNSITGNSSAKGTEVWYFTPYSQPLASSISANVAAYFQNNAYSDGVNRNRGAKYSYYHVTLAHDFPSVLVELGFVTNYEDAMAMASGQHQNGIANAIATGIQQYVAR